MIIPNIDNVEKFEDIFSDFKTDFQIFDDNLNNFNENIHEIDTPINNLNCVCGRIIQSNNIYKLLNITTQITLLIGCDCIDKYKILSKEELNALKLKRQFKQRTKVSNCLFCGKKGGCKACKNAKWAKVIFNKWLEFSKKLAYNKRGSPDRVSLFQKRRLSRLLKPLVIKYKYVTFRLPQKKISFKNGDCRGY